MASKGLEKGSDSESLTSSTPISPSPDAASVVSEDSNGGRIRSGRVRSAVRSSTPSSRPIPHYYDIRDPDVEAEAMKKMKEAANTVDITKIFRAYVPQDYLLRLNKEERERLEDERKAAIIIQRSYRRHLNRCRGIEEKSRDQDMKKWTRTYKKMTKLSDKTRQIRLSEDQRQTAALRRMDAQKLAMIGPHIDIYEKFHPPREGPTKRERHCAAVMIQKHIRGWLTRCFMKRLRRKALYHADSFRNFVGDYFSLMRRIQRRNGVRHVIRRFNLREMEEFMDSKRRYELAFDSKAFRGMLREKDLMNFFYESDLAPARNEIREALELLYKNKTMQEFTKPEALELVFQIYKPRGTDLYDTRKSTWMHPLLNGVDAIKLVDPDDVEDTPLSVCFKLVFESRRKELSWEQTQAVKAHIKQLEEAESQKRGERALWAKIRHNKEQARTVPSAGISWIKD